MKHGESAHAAKKLKLISGIMVTLILMALTDSFQFHIFFAQALATQISSFDLS